MARNASELLQSLTGITIPHQSVIALKNYADEKAKTYEKALAEENEGESPAQLSLLSSLSGKGTGVTLANWISKGMGVTLDFSDTLPTEAWAACVYLHTCDPSLAGWKRATK